MLQLIETGGPGGAEKVLIQLTERLDADRDFRSTAGLLKSGWLEEELAARGLDVHRFHLRHPLDARLVLDLARHIRRSKVDVVHAHEFTMNVFGAAAGRLAGVPVIATVHGRGYYAEARRRIAALKLAGRLGAVWVAVSNDIGRFLETLGLGPVRLIPNGIDVDRPAGGDRRRGRNAIGVSAGTPLVGSVGNLYPVKGHAVLIQAMARLKTAGVHLAIAGRGGEEAALRELAGELGIAERVHLLGYRDDIPDLLAAFDIYALPSFSEGQSLALIEAMAAAKPIVATAVGGNPEVLGGEGSASGFLVPPGDAEALAMSLDRLLTESCARPLGEEARLRAREEFSIESMLARYRALYAARLEARSRRRGGEGSGA